MSTTDLDAALAEGRPERPLAPNDRLLNRADTDSLGLRPSRRLAARLVDYRPIIESIAALVERRTRYAAK